MSETEAPAAKPSSGPSGIIIAVVVLVLALGGAYALCAFVLPDKLADAIAKRMGTGDDGAAAAPKSGEEKKAEGGKEGAKTEGGAKDFVLTDLLVNITGTGGSRFVKTTVFFDAEPAVLADLDKNRAKITDIVQQTIASKKMEDLTGPDSRGKLRSELLATINPLLSAKGEIRNIYFQEFIIQ